MNLHLAIQMKGFVSTLMIWMMIIIITLCAATFFFLAPNFGAKAYAQEINNDNKYAHPGGHACN